MVVRTQTSAPAQKYTFGSPVVVADGGFTPILLSRDRTTFYARAIGANAQPNALYKSTDGGTTWTLLVSFATAIGGGTIPYAEIDAMLERPDGEMIFAFSAFGSFAPLIYVSTGWATNPATATYSLRFTMLGGSSNAISRYSLNNSCIGTNGVVLATESGPQTAAPSGVTITNAGTGYTAMTLAATSAGTGESFGVNLDPVTGAIRRIGVLNGGSGHTNGTFSFTVTGTAGVNAAATYTVSGGVIQGSILASARRLYLSTDFGTTWGATPIFDVSTTPAFKYGVGMHLHCAAYDEAWDRIWLCTGDNSGDGLAVAGGATKTQVWYSDDRGTTWNTLPAETYIGLQSITGQYTGIKITSSSVILTTDQLNPTFFSFVYPRTGYRTLGTPVFGAGQELAGQSIGAQLFSNWSPYNAGFPYPLFATYVQVAGTATRPSTMCTSDGGRTWTEFWRETDFVTRPSISNAYISTMLGPDTSNRMVGYYFGYASLLKGTLVTNF